MLCFSNPALSCALDCISAGVTVVDVVQSLVGCVVCLEGSRSISVIVSSLLLPCSSASRCQLELLSLNVVFLIFLHRNTSPGYTIENPSRL